ncbi:MAG: carbohydrate binding family 9 domain-containing protein [Acidobacteria bacterium]|nr:carbohydrate binding family 9 domain-containing protein [Acidobacteriota bacterium]
MFSCRDAPAGRLYGARRYCLCCYSAVVAFLLLCLLIASPGYGYGQGTAYGNAGTHGKKTIQAVRTELPVVLDGKLDEPVWWQAPVSLGFVQKDPKEGEPSTERTEFHVVYTSQTLYIGVICYDSNPQDILATERRRDNNLENDDTLTIVLDTFHDHRNSYLFRTNPLGTQYDASVTDEGRSLNENWDEKWEVASQILEVGWVAEFAIPFKSLRMGEQNEIRWGLDLERVIRRKNEFSYWNGYRRSFKLENVSQAGHLDGLQGVDPGMRMRVKPFTVGGFQQSSSLSRHSFRNASDIGMEVLKYRITPGLTADFTWNTDFAQTEVDDQQVSLDRFPLFYPEKREFFLEGAGIFEFGRARAEFVPEMRLLHTRRIGMTPDSSAQVPMTAGARMTGNWQGFTLGLMNVQTEALESHDVSASNYSVVRVKRNVLDRSFLGGFILNREVGESADFNRVYGLDANFTFRKYLQILGTWVTSDQPGSRRDNSLANGSIWWDTDFWAAGLEFVSVEPNFRNDLGFLRRKDWRRHTASFAINPRPKSGPIRRIWINPRFDYETDSQWRFDRRLAHFHTRVEFHSGDSIGISPHLPRERLVKPFVLRYRVAEVAADGQLRKEPLVVVPAGEYKWAYVRLRYTANPARRLSGFVEVSPTPGYYGGDLVEYIFSPQLKVTDKLAVEVSYRINDGRVAETDFTDHVVNFRVHYNFSNQWLTTTTVQYNNADAFAGLNFRLNYIFRPGDDFFLVYNEGRRLGDVFEDRKDRTLQVKFTYSFDF